MVSCFVYGCSSGYNGAKTHLFKAPTTANKSEWVKNIPKREIPFDFSKSKLCHLHFEESCIVKNSEFITINGETVKNPAQVRWTLKPNSIPTRFENEKLSMYYNKPEKRKSPKKRLFTAVKTQDCSKVQDFQDFKAIKKDPSILKLPAKSWIVQAQDQDDASNEPVFVHQLSSEENHGFIVTKTLTILHTGKIKVVVRGKNMTHLFSISEIPLLEEIEHVLHNLNNMRICEGVGSFPDFAHIKKVTFVNDKMFSMECETLASQIRCKHCNQLLMKLRVMRSKRRKRIKRVDKQIPSSPSKTRAYAKLLQRRISKQNFTIRRMQSKSISQKLQLKNMRRKMSSLKEDEILAFMKHSKIPEQMTLSFATALKLAKAKSSKGNRYESEWLLQCLLLKIKSPKAYIYLRENQMLPLPHPSTIHRLIRSVPCDFGFQEHIFDTIKAALRGKEFKDKQGILLFDEIKVRESLDFSKADVQFKGFIDYHDYQPDYLEKQSSKAGMLEDHALVFMIRSLNSSWAQPIGSFATRGAAPGFMLAKLLLGAIIKLEEVGFRVVGCTCDGAKTNKNMWTEFGISGKLKSSDEDYVVNKVLHPCDENTWFHFLSDVPHIIKCIRNHLMKHRKGMFAGTEVDYNYYSKLYEYDCSLGSLRLAPKITANHINPSPFQKMVVSYATQLFSRSVADAILVCRTQNIPGFDLSYHTEKFTREINDFFDALNSNRVQNSIVDMSSHKVETLQRFLRILNDPGNCFASDCTMESMRVTVRSALDILDYLFKLGFSFVLTNKLNQDCLEKFFGIIRSMGGSDDHPTVLSFMQLFRLMCVYIPTRIQISGNISRAEVMPESLHQFSSLMKKQSKEVCESNIARRNMVEDRILEKIVFGDSISLTALREHDYCKSDVPDGIVFYLAGYVAFKGSRFTNCSECLLSLVNNSLPTVPSAQLLRLKCIGELKYPSDPLFQLLKAVEFRVSEKLSSDSVQSDTVLEIIQSLDIRVSSLGCNEDHGTLLTARIVSFYISLRCFFHCKLYNNQTLLKKKQTKVDRKKVKLH